MKGKRRRLWEGCKSLLIVVLSCSAVYLAGATLFPQGTWGFVSHLAPGAAPSEGGHSSSFLYQTIRPGAFAVTWEDGRYALMAHQDDQEALDQLSAILAEAMSGAGTPSATTSRVWENALASPGVFCEYLAPIPLDTLSRWLSEQTNPALAGMRAQRLCVCGDALLFLDVQSASYYTCPLSRDLSDALADFADRFSSNGASFAFERSEESYQLLRRDSLLLDTTPSLPALSAENPITVSDTLQPGEGLDRVLQHLSFHPQTNPLYAAGGGYAITDGSETLRISADGQLTYRRSQEGEARFAVNDSPLDATRALAEETLGSLCGAARLSLLEVRQEGETMTLSYGYAYRGAAIRVDGGDWCAQFTVEDAAVSAFTLKPRRYTALTDAPVMLLPQEQAAAGLRGGRGQSLCLLYEDDRQSTPLVPFWAVRANGR